MKILRVIRALAVYFALIGLVFPLHTIAAGPRNVPAASGQSPRETRVLDVRLGKGGQLEGIVMDPAGKPVSQPIVVAELSGKLAGRGLSAADGRFAIPGLRGGIYQLATPNSAVVCRLWTEGAAPPVAQPRMLLVSDPDVQRGQRPIGELLFSPSAIIAAIIVAAIAIPIAVHNSQNDAS